MHIELTHKSMVHVLGPVIMEFNGIWLRGELMLGYNFGGSGAELKKFLKI